MPHSSVSLWVRHPPTRHPKQCRRLQACACRSLCCCCWHFFCHCALLSVLSVLRGASASSIFSAHTDALRAAGRASLSFFMLVGVTSLPRARGRLYSAFEAEHNYGLKMDAQCMSGPRVYVRVCDSVWVASRHPHFVLCYQRISLPLTSIASHVACLRLRRVTRTEVPRGFRLRPVRIRYSRAHNSASGLCPCLRKRVVLAPPTYTSRA